MSAPRPAAVPYLAVSDAEAAMRWYAEVLGAEVVGEPYVEEDGRVGHAELRVGDGVLYLADEHPELGVVAPTAGAFPVSLVLTVADADATFGRAVDAGGRGERAVETTMGTRSGWLVDPFGHRWNLRSPAAD